MLPIVEAWPATSRCAPRCANHSSKHLDSPVAICYTHSMSTTMPMRVDGDLFEAAKSVGAVASRSAAQQISHWARIGSEHALDSAGACARRRLALAPDPG